MASEALQGYLNSIDGARSLEDAAHGWRRAVEACAVEVQGIGCQCAELANPRLAARALAGEAPHESLCPVALTARLRRLA